MYHIAHLLQVFNAFCGKMLLSGKHNKCYFEVCEGWLREEAQEALGKEGTLKHGNHEKRRKPRNTRHPFRVFRFLSRHS